MGQGGAHWLVLDSWSAAAAVTLPSSGFRTQNLVCDVCWFGWKNCSHAFSKAHARDLMAVSFHSIDVLYLDMHSYKILSKCIFDRLCMF